MPKWYETANEASFKLAPGGYVFQAPNPWVLARPRYYVVNEAQKAELLPCLGRWRLLLIIGIVIQFSLAVFVWPETLGHLLRPYRQMGTGFYVLFLGALVMLLSVPLIAAPQIYLARALRPILANTPRSKERITLREQLPRIATSAPGKLIIVGLIAGLVTMGGGTLIIFDAFLEGRLARSAPSAAALLIAGGLLTAYFVYLLRLKAKSKRTKTA